LATYKDIPSEVYLPGREDHPICKAGGTVITGALCASTDLRPDLRLGCLKEVSEALFVFNWVMAKDGPRLLEWPKGSYELPEVMIH